MSNARRHATSQVKLDVDRSLWRFPKGIRHHERVQLRRGITDVLDAILGPNPHLHYYQVRVRCKYRGVLQ